MKKCCGELSVYDDVPPEPTVRDADKLGDAAREMKPDAIVGVGGGSVLDMAKGAGVLANNPGSIKDYFGTGLVKTPRCQRFCFPPLRALAAKSPPMPFSSMRKRSWKVGVVSPTTSPGGDCGCQADLVGAAADCSPPARDAFTHAVESYTSVRASIHSDLFAAESIPANRQEFCGRWWPIQETWEARYDMALGSVYGGIALEHGGDWCGSRLGLSFRRHLQGIPHGVSNALLLPYVMEFNYLANLERFCIVARLMGEPMRGCPPGGAWRAVEAIKALVEDVGIPTSCGMWGSIRARRPSWPMPPPQVTPPFGQQSPADLAWG